MERKEKKQQRLLSAARIAGARIIASRRHHPSESSHPTTAEADSDALVGVLQEHLIGFLLGATEEANDSPLGEDDFVEHEDWAGTVGQLVQILDGLQPAHRELLLLFAHGHDIKEIAAARDVDYSTLLDQFHRQLALVRARLEGANVRQTPKRPADATSVLHDPGLCVTQSLEAWPPEQGAP